MSSSVLFFTVLMALLKRVAPDSYRTCQFWNQYLPIHIRYIFTKTKYKESRGYTLQEVEEAWQRRHSWGAEKVSNLLQDMSGYYVKSAQILASKGDFLPAEWIQTMTPIFFDNMKPHSWAAMEKNLACFLQDTALVQQAASTGKVEASTALSFVFNSCCPESIASASIAQVHPAVLSDSALEVTKSEWQDGTEVVLKIQHTRMQNLMDSDIRNLRRLCAFVRPVLPYDPTPMLDEMRDTVGKEFDFVREARLMLAIRKRLQDLQCILIPKPLLSLTTPELLVMQRMSGVPFSRILQDRNPELMAQAGKAVPQLIEAYGKMMFQDGLFHADPHAGNLLLQDDGKLVLLDFGQCKALSATRHKALAQLIVTMDEGNKLAIALAMSRFGMDFTALGGGLPDPELIQTIALIVFDTRPLPGVDINPLSEDAAIQKIPLKEAPEDLFSLGRTIMLLRGLCHALGLDIEAGKIWRPYAEAALRKSDKELAELASINLSLDNGTIAIHVT